MKSQLRFWWFCSCKPFRGETTSGLRQTNSWEPNTNKVKLRQQPSSLFHLSKNKLYQSKTTLKCNKVEPKMAADLYWLLIGSSVEQMERLKSNYVTTPHETCPSLKLLQMLLLLPVSGGRTATILRGLTYPKILCAPEKEERKRENGDIAWRRSSLSRAWAAEIVT